MSITDIPAVTGPPGRRSTGRPGRPGVHAQRAHAPANLPSTRRGDAKVIELTLLDIFEATVAQWGDRPAADAPRGVLTYNDLGQEVQELADRLRDGGVGPGDRVGVRVPSGKADLYVAILGALTAGAAYVPAQGRRSPGSRRADLCRRRGVRGGGRGARAGVARSRRRPCRLSDPGRRRLDHLHLGLDRRSEGRRRPALGRRGIVRAENDLWTVRPEDRVLAGLSVAFDASCEEMWGKGLMVRRWFPPRGHSCARASSSDRG